MTVASIVTTVFTVLGVASVLLRIIAPLTKNKVDDKFSKFLDELLRIISLDSNSKNLKRLEIGRGDDKITIPLRKRK